MGYEIVEPAYKVGDRVELLHSPGMVGEIVQLYSASGVPMWYGTRRIQHTTCYQIKTRYGDMWGLVDAIIKPAQGE